MGFLSLMVCGVGRRFRHHHYVTAIPPPGPATDVGDDEDALRAADGEKVPTSDHTHIHMSHVTQP